MKYLFTTWLLTIVVSVSVLAQKQVDRVKFFTDTSVVNATLSINYKRVQAEKIRSGRGSRRCFHANWMMDQRSTIIFWLRSEGISGERIVICHP